MRPVDVAINVHAPIGAGVTGYRDTALWSNVETGLLTRYLTPLMGKPEASLAPLQFRALVYVFAYGGLRWGEAVALRRRRVDVLRSRLEVAESMADVAGQIIFGPTKNYRNRTLVLPRFLRDMLNDHLLHYTGPGPE